MKSTVVGDGQGVRREVGERRGSVEESFRVSGLCSKARRL